MARDPASVVRESDLTLLCVKPQDIGALMADLAAHAKGKRFVSILAGTRIARLQEGLGTTHVARFMPNIAAVAGRALVGVSFAPEVDPALQGRLPRPGGGLRHARSRSPSASWPP